MTGDRWHLTHDTWCGLNILSKCQLSSSNGLGFLMFWRSGGKESLNQSISEGINVISVCKTVYTGSVQNYSGRYILSWIIWMNMILIILYILSYEDNQSPGINSYVHFKTCKSKDWHCWTLWMTNYNRGKADYVFRSIVLICVRTVLVPKIYSCSLLVKFFFFLHNMSKKCNFRSAHDYKKNV